MNRLLINGEWFEPIDPSSYFEQDFEDRITDNADRLFEGWRVVPFRCQIYARDSGFTPRRPDLALIHPEYREWWVVEVELASHNLSEHVAPQVGVFSLGTYDAHHAKYLYERCRDLDPIRTEALVVAVQPGVLVVVNDEVPGWHAALDAYGARICVMKPYRSKLGKSCNIVLGDLPAAESSLVSRCQYADGLPRAIALQNAAVYVAEPGSAVQIDTPAGSTTWMYERLDKSAFLLSTGRYPFPANVRQFELHRDSAGRLRLEPITRRNAWTCR